MIEIKCPACEAEGRAPKNKINTRLVCRKCLRVFHLTPTGRPVLGEPPNAGTTSTVTPHELHAPDSAQKVDQWFDRASRLVFSTKSLVIAVGLILLAAVLAFLSFRRPETLQDRVTKVAKAAVQGDLQTVRQMAATGTGDDVVKWYESVCDRCDELRQHLGTHKLIVEVDVKQQDDQQGSAETVVRLETEEAIERKGTVLPDPSIIANPPSRESVSIPMAWKSEGWFGWKLDGKRTLELTSSTP